MIQAAARVTVTVTVVHPPGSGRQWDITIVGLNMRYPGRAAPYYLTDL